MPADDALRDRLVRVGAELLRTEGPGTLSLREIARRAGVSHGAPRRYFPTHLSLLSAIAHVGFADLKTQVQAALEAAGPDPRRRLATLARLYVRFAATDRAMFDLMFRHDLLQSGGELGLRHAALPLFTLLVELVTAVHPTPDPPAEITAAALWSALHGLAELSNWGSLTLATGETDPASVIDAILTAHLGPRRTTEGA
ncbi:TetR family transcriptional regulator [Actinoplanes sp. SE50]|uniref:TetR/AcrR family transcriptional regulator n=1 Tax=unclassified Actinoplanes TaxID=2626549 RepID=UPI00023ED4EF|nr:MULTISPECIES: TetR/AcrR family transcriptional regulator [unclassified Actinoplanes]AEV87340.1 TetR family transcriptional regulator [Actinoplanes sp. SE50/110]ATO85740.1 TetR family transcriptional regulator [Actinoplanes sp. SE50]SLM03153.1 TetR family transcriptional regulator [Actinoplanes sp. SE50/110]